MYGGRQVTTDTRSPSKNPALVFEFAPCCYWPRLHSSCSEICTVSRPIYSVREPAEIGSPVLAWTCLQWALKSLPSSPHALYITNMRLAGKQRWGRLPNAIGNAASTNWLPGRQALTPERMDYVACSTVCLCVCACVCVCYLCPVVPVCLCVCFLYNAQAEG